jgi:hypothetical protein
MQSIVRIASAAAQEPLSGGTVMSPLLNNCGALEPECRRLRRYLQCLGHGS